MKRLSFFVKLLLVTALFSIIPFFSLIKLHVGLKIAVGGYLSIIFVVLLIIPESSELKSRKLRALSSGCFLTKLAGIAVATESVILWLYISRCSPSTVNMVFSILLPVLLSAVMIWCGVIRIVVCSRQIKLADYILLLVFWWIPLVNLIFIIRFYRIARRELSFESKRQELENARAANEICRTRYPVVMVHGIFFRDWQFFNYWGRIPAALKINGADIFYGGQQSSQSVEKSAEELKNRILEVIAETGAEKVNIIAHSKGGLDARYALSVLGMDKYTATLTTLCTPHKGCELVDYLLEKLPDSIIRFCERRYNGIFARLGDRSPDFMSGINDLRASRSEELNSMMPDSPLVSYRSFMTVMKSAWSAAFPLNLGFRIIKRLSGESDGLVYRDAAVHGKFTLVRPEGRQGISHGDVIDLTGKNVSGFDVREFYVDILRSLKAEGY